MTAKVTIKKSVGNEWKSQSTGEGESKVNGNHRVIKVDTALSGLTGDFDFKWADKSTTDGQILRFPDQGDAASNTASITLTLPRPPRPWTM